MDQQGGELTRDAYWKGLNAAIGARIGPDGKQTGGLGRWGDNWFVLPEGVTAEAFGVAVARAAKDGKVKPVRAVSAKTNIEAPPLSPGSS